MPAPEPQREGALGLLMRRRRWAVREGTLHGREVQRRFAELIRQGRPRRAYGFLGPTLAATAAGDRDRFYSPELFRETAERIPGPACSCTRARATPAC